MRKQVATAALVLAILGACSNVSAPERSAEFTAEVRGDTLFLFNGTDRPVYYIVTPVERFGDILALTCTGPGCPAVAPDGEETMLLRDAFPEPTTRDLFLHWWHAASDPRGGFRPDSVHTGKIPR